MRGWLGLVHFLSGNAAEGVKLACKSCILGAAGDPGGLRIPVPLAEAHAG